MKFFFGFAIGLAGALLFAPARGEETRNRLFERGRELASDPQAKLNETVQRVSETAREKAGEIGSVVGRQTAEAIANSVIGKPEGRTA